MLKQFNILKPTVKCVKPLIFDNFNTSIFKHPMSYLFIPLNIQKIASEEKNKSWQILILTCENHET